MSDNTLKTLLNYTAPLSQQDAELIKLYQSIWSEANTRGDSALMNAAHSAAEAIRAGYGYSGGPDGSQVIPLETSPVAIPYSYTSRSDYLKNNGYSDIENSLQAASERQIQAAEQKLESQKAQVSRDSDELARQAYIAYMQGREALPQQLTALGYNGGLSETRQVALEAGWQDRRNQIGLEKQRQISALDLAIFEARNNGELELAKSLASLQTQAQSQWNNYQAQQNQYARDDYYRALDDAYRRQEAQYKLVMDYLDAKRAEEAAAYQASRDALYDSRYQAEQEAKKKQQELENELAWKKLDQAIQEMKLKYK